MAQLWDTTQHGRMNEPLDTYSPSPEAVSLSDKLDKSDEKMDTSETSRSSSEKTLPLDDLEVQTSVELNNSLTNTITSSATNTAAPTATATITTTPEMASTNANLLLRKSTETHSETAASNARTDSTASTSSLQDTDLELPSNYQTETVDFPDSPRQLKLMNQSTNGVQGASIDESLQEEDEETEQPDDEVFRAVLSPSSEGVKLKKARRKRISPEIARDSTPPQPNPPEDFSLQDMVEGDPSEENMSAHTAEKFYNSGQPDVPQCSNGQSSENNSLNFSCDFWNLQEHLESKNFYSISTPLNSERFQQKFDFSNSSITEQRRQKSNNNKSKIQLFSDISNDSISINTIQKVHCCFDKEKIKDISVLGGKLQDILTPDEIKEILDNSETYASYFEDDIFESLQYLQLTSNTRGDPDGSAAKSKTKITVNKEELDQSIADHFESELYISAVFEGTKSLKRPKKSQISNQHSYCADNLTLREVPCGITRAYFEECENEIPSASVKKKIKAPITLNLLDVSTSPEVDGIAMSPLEFCGGGFNTESRQDENKSAVASNFNAVERDSHACDPIQMTPRRIQRDEWQEERTFQERPNTLSASGKKKRKIRVNPDILNSTDEFDDNKSLSSLSNRSEGDILSPIDDMATPDDIDTPEELEDSTCSPSEPIPEVSAAEERDEERRWRTCVIGGVQRKIDMKVIEPYKKVLSHGGYYGPKRSAIIVFCACYLPDHSRKDYDYVMDNLFLYVLTTLDQLVAEDYILVYLHGAMDRNNMPTFGWLKRCYQMIDRRLRKNLKGLYLVHPTFWLKTIVLMTKPFISSKFSRKLQFVNTLQELTELVPIDQMSIPDRVKQLEFELMIKEKKRHLKPPKQITPKPKKHKENTSNCDGDGEEAYRRSQVGYITFTGGWV